jgi:hypothetical protein
MTDLSEASPFALLLFVDSESLDACAKTKTHTQNIRPAQQINRLIIAN